MKKYCFDTSAISNPLETMPEDIHTSLWAEVRARIAAGIFAVTREIFDEMAHIQGATGECIRANELNLLLEVNDRSWPFERYIEHAARMQIDHARFIRENLGDRRGTVGINDISIIALGKCLGLPVVSMEKRKAHQNGKLRQIPDICDSEGICHMTFNEFLRAEWIRI